MNASELLTIWEKGQESPPLERVFMLLETVLPDTGHAQLGQLTLGQKEAWLLRLREQLFGPELRSVVDCPACAEKLEFSFTATQLGVQPWVGLPEAATLEVDGLELIVRPVTLADLVAAKGDGRALFERVIAATEIPSESKAVTVAELPDSLALRVASELQTVDPLMEIKFQLDCPNCQHDWEAPFDTLSFLWAEIESWARSMIHTVHRLARAYGWSERDILAMSAWRRQLYLSRVQA